MTEIKKTILYEDSMKSVQNLSILPLHNTVLFPHTLLPVDVTQQKSINLVKEIIAQNQLIIGAATWCNWGTSDTSGCAADKTLYTVGCAASILKIIKIADDQFTLILQGIVRIRLFDCVQQDPFVTFRVEPVPDQVKPDAKLKDLMLSLINTANQVHALRKIWPLKKHFFILDQVNEPGQLADLIASELDASVAEKQEVLDTCDLQARLQKVLSLLSRQLN